MNIKSQEDSYTPAELTEFRRQIDALDDKIINLLIERIGIVNNVGKMKRKKFPDICPIRAGREADMINRVMAKFEGSLFPPAAAASIWRTLIGASTSLENLLSISAYTPEGNNDFYWMAREYFGPFQPVNKQPNINQAISDVTEGNAAIAIVPQLCSSDESQWWMNLLQQGKNTPKIFAHIPFVYFGKQEMNDPAALAISRLSPEETGNDTSFIVIKADENISQSKLQASFVDSKLDAKWVQVASIEESKAKRYHLVKIDGFITTENTCLKNIGEALKQDIHEIYFIGAYAKPEIAKLPYEKTEK